LLCRVDLHLGDFSHACFYLKRFCSSFATDSVQNHFLVGYADLAQRLENSVAAAATAANCGSAPAALAATQAMTPTNVALPPATARKANRVLPQDVDWASVHLPNQVSAVTPPEVPA
jgi:hypothetical protein